MNTGKIIKLNNCSGALTSAETGDLFFRFKPTEKFAIDDSVTFLVLVLSTGNIAVNVKKVS